MGIFACKAQWRYGGNAPVDSLRSFLRRKFDGFIWDMTHSPMPADPTAATRLIDYDEGRPLLSLVDSKGKEVAVFINSDIVFLIGRESESGYVSLLLDDPLVSNWHAFLMRDNASNVVFLKDLGSANGTFVNGERLGRVSVILEDGDMVGFGSRDKAYAFQVRLHIAGGSDPGRG